MQKELVFLKGNRDGIEVVLDDGEAFNEVFVRLHEKIKLSLLFFSGSSVTVNAGQRTLSSNEENQIKELLQQEFNLSYAGIVGSGALQNQPVDTQGTALPVEKMEEERLTEPFHGKDQLVKGARAGKSVIVKKTLRGGQSIEFSGSIVVLGDVNPAAKVVAEGDVVIMGTVRGFVHAGSKGNKEAIVAALRFVNPLIQIAGIKASPELPLERHEPGQHPSPFQLKGIKDSPELPLEPCQVARLEKNSVVFSIMDGYFGKESKPR